MKQGYTDVSVYVQGFPEWKKSGYPVETIPDIVLPVTVPLMTAADLKARLDRREAVTVVDLRDEEDRAAGHIAGSLGIPLEDLMARFEEVPKASTVVLACLRGKQGPIAGQYLVKKGYAKVFVLENGVKDGWVAAGYPVVK